MAFAKNHNEVIDMCVILWSALLIVVQETMLFFFFLKREGVHVVVDHLALVAAVCCFLPLPAFWNRCRRMYVWFHISSWKETNLKKFLYLSLFE